AFGHIEWNCRGPVRVASATVPPAGDQVPLVLPCSARRVKQASSASHWRVRRPLVLLCKNSIRAKSDCPLRDRQQQGFVNRHALVEFALRGRWAAGPIADDH